MQRESARMWQMQSRILVRAEFCACGQWHGGESGEFTHRPQSNEIRANSRITRHSEVGRGDAPCGIPPEESGYRKVIRFRSGLFDNLDGGGRKPPFGPSRSW
jgi:hypothetical protein